MVRLKNIFFVFVLAFQSTCLWDGQANYKEAELKVSRNIPKSSYSYEISIAIISEKEHSYLAEWIDYHLLVGVDHFYFYDNNDGEETKEVLTPYINKGIVEYFKWPGRDPPYFQRQIDAYKDVLERCRGATKWISFLDADEFIVPTKYYSLKETLHKEYENKPLIYLNWRMFGTSFRYLPPPTQLLPYLVRCSEKNSSGNRWGKIIVQPQYVPSFGNYHITPGLVGYADGSGNPFPYSTVNELWENWEELQVNDDLLRINHYTLRDEWFWENVKLARCLFFGRDPTKEYDNNLKYWNTQEDTRIIEIMNSFKE